MRTEKEIERMFGRVVNALGWAVNKNKDQRAKKDILYGMSQILDWIRTEGEEEELTERLTRRIVDLCGHDSI